MLWHAIAPSRRYTKASHDIVRHARLGSDAKILLLYVQGLPEGQSGQALSEHARKLRITGRAYQKAKQQLIENGFVHEWRRQGDRGFWVTDQLFANTPLTEEQARRARDGLVVMAEVPPGARNPAVGRPGGRVVGDSQPVDEERVKNVPHPPSEAEPEAAAAECGPEVAEAEGVLLSLRHANPQLHLGVPEARGLAGLAAEWIRRGVTAAGLRRTLMSELPSDGVRSAVGFLRHRLEQKLPPPPEPVAPAPVASVPRSVTCAGPGEEHVFRTTDDDETHCGPCRREAAWDLYRARAEADEEVPPHIPWRERIAALAASPDGDR
ncbi:hypothetical protein ACIPJO_08460 [Streptomyces sp. NPDC086993]|uniref:hypothetical protein n=1 Tax=unclassified Streptomyces TaxID=2593676 RepID=UPI0037164668